MKLQTEWLLTWLLSLISSFTLYLAPLPQLFHPVSTHPAEFVLTLGAGVHEGLGDDREWGVHHFRHMDIEDEVGIFQDVHPEAQWKAAQGETGGGGWKEVRYYCFRTEKFQPHYIREACHELPEMQLSAANDNNSGESGEELLL